MATGRGHWNYRLTKWLLGTGLLTTVLLLTACECGMTPPLTTTTPTTTTAPPEVREGLAILSHSSYVDNFGYFHLVGEVENVDSENTEMNKVTVTFFDDEGNTVNTASNYTYLDILKPGRKSPFEIVLSAPPPVANYKLESTWQITSREPYTDLNIEATTFEREEQGWGYLSGQVKNTGSETVEVIAIDVTFYDTSGKVVGAVLTFADIPPLGPNESSPFEAIIDPEVVRTMQTYSLQAEGLREP